MPGRRAYNKALYYILLALTGLDMSIPNSEPNNSLSTINTYTAKVSIRIDCRDFNV